MLTTLSLLFLLGASPNDSTPTHEENFLQLMARYQAASEASQRSLVLCLEPKFRVGKALMAEYPRAKAARKTAIETDMAILERSSVRCIELHE